MYNITCFPIIILSSVRTGSTVLVHDINQELKKQGKTLQVFSEPIKNPEYKKYKSFEHNFFINYKNNDYILKTHAYDLKLYPKHILDMISERSCFLIRIRRRNIQEQILSWNIARQIREFGYYNDLYGVLKRVLDTSKELKVSLPEINKDILFVKKYNKVIDEIDIKFDLDLFYEDLDFKSKYMIKSPKPINHEKIREVIKELCR